MYDRARELGEKEPKLGVFVSQETCRLRRIAEIESLIPKHVLTLAKA